MFRGAKSAKRRGKGVMLSAKKVPESTKFGGHIVGAI